MAARMAPCGGWASPVTPEIVSGDTLLLGQVQFAGGAVRWIESRPREEGRCVIVEARPDGSRADLIPAGYSARNRVYEYGGGDYCAVDDDLAFVEDRNQQIHVAHSNGSVRQLTAEPECRFADLSYISSQRRIVCVREEHGRGVVEPRHSVVAVSLDDGLVTELTSGRDFYAAARPSADGRSLLWLEWDHPNMPWDGTELVLAEFGSRGEVLDPRLIAGGRDESIVQPEWGPDGSPYFLSDRTGWWNLYRWDGRSLVALVPRDAEFAGPHWNFAPSTYGFADGGDLVTAFLERGRWRLAVLEHGQTDLRTIETPFSVIASLRVSGGEAAFIGGAPDRPTAVVRIELATGEFHSLRSAVNAVIDRSYVSVPELIEFPTEGGLTAFGFYYPPVNPAFDLKSGERPPLRVIAHGGPTGGASPVYQLGVQFWTTRGFAVLDVNYGGSAGHGREYRRRLEGQWGVVDVTDCINGAGFLASQGLVDEARMVIAGGSAGGFTTLAALTFRDVFAGGACLYGISDLETMTLDTHKFESRYLHRLVGPYPERKDLYLERSPIHWLHRLTAPLIVFQGMLDRVVPPDQSERLVEALRKQGNVVRYVSFPAEYHGFRQAETVQRVLREELAFYSELFGFDLPTEPYV